jgi:hypothetical protein
MGKIDPLKILTDLDGDKPPLTEDLQAAHDELKAALDAATTADTPDLALAKDLHAGVSKLATELAARAEVEAKEREELAELRKGLFDDKAKDPAPSDPKDPAEPKDPAPAEPEKKVEEPVTASAGADIVARLTAFADKKAPPAPAPKTVNATRSRAIGVASGFELERGDFNDLGALFSTHAKAVTNPGQTGHMFRLTREFEQDRQLGFNVDLNNQRMLGVFGVGQNFESPVAAACGMCGPGDVDHTHPICSEDGRPIRDALPQFQATRGKITFAPAASIGDLSGNVSIWTEAMDIAACAVGSPGSDIPTKPCPPIACPEELTCATDAVVRCITVGNFQAQFSPEFWASRLALLLAEFDRVAEQKIIEEIHDASTDLGIVDECNTLNSFLMGINSVIAADRSAQRNMSRRYRIIADAYIRDYMRNQVIKNLGVANNIGALQLADATINGWLSDVGASVVWTFDGTFGAGVDGQEHRILLPGEVPTEAGVYVQPEDSFVFLDGGTLDLGTDIHDSMLNSTNDRQAFAETFEKTCFRGCSAYYFEIPVHSGCGCGSAGACDSTSPA